MYEKQVHKDGIKRVVLSNDSSTARCFDKAELVDLFKVRATGTCIIIYIILNCISFYFFLLLKAHTYKGEYLMMDKFNSKVENNGTGSTGKRSFLSMHPSVLGVASHDVLYSNVSVDVDLTALPSSEEAAFSRSCFQKSKLGKSNQTVQVEDLTRDIN